MAIWLLLPAAVFAYLAYDAWRLRTPENPLSYSVEAEVRGEPVAHVSLQEQSQRKVWGRRYGIGDPGGIFWLWVILGVGCFGGALIGAYS